MTDRRDPKNRPNGDAADRALRDSRKELVEAQTHLERADALAEESQRLRGANHFAERIRLAYARKA